MVETNTEAFNEKFVAQSRELVLANRKAAQDRKTLQMLEASYKELEQFSYFAAHDLKAPLRGISAWLEMLKEDFEGTLPAEGLEFVERAMCEALRLRDLIEALLALGRSETVKLQKEQICLRKVMDDVIGVLEPEIRQAGARIEVDPALGSLEADDVLFRLLAQNLIGNAIRYRSADRPLVVRILRCEAPLNGIEVVDNGRGFEDKHKHSIFQPFKRLASTSDVRGSGVGLAICTRICERHGWRLTAEGVPDAGATFRIIFDRT